MADDGCAKPSEESKRNKRMEAAKAALFDAEEGTFLGRTPQSWGRILGFYLVYYTFLLLLFLFTIWCVELRIKGNEEGKGHPSRPVINTRLDEPGLAVFPHTSVLGLDDDLNKELIIRTKPSTKEHRDYEKMLTNAYYHRILEPNLRKCDPNSAVHSYSKNIWKTDVKQGLKNAGMKGLISGLRSYHPVFFLRLNKIVNWKPVPVTQVSTELQKAIAGPENRYRYQHDMVYFTCKPESRVNVDSGKEELTTEGANVKKVTFHNPTGPGGCRGLNSEDVGCIPASWYEGANTFKGHNPFSTKAANVDDDEMAANVASCWPFIAATASPKDPKLPMKISCQVHLANVQVRWNQPQNYGWVSFGFKPAGQD